MSFAPTPLGKNAVGHERRRNRSADTLVALSRLLESARKQSGLPALAVADDRGLVVAGAGEYRACEELAAWAPLLAFPAKDIRASRSEAPMGRVRRVAVDGIDVFVCGQGGASECDEALRLVASGCQRILGSRTRLI